jgi:hypothetical protein
MQRPPKTLKEVEDPNFTSSTAITPIIKKSKSSTKVSLYNPLTRVKPLMPNILDQAAIEQVYKRAAIKRASGRKFVQVQES